MHILVINSGSSSIKFSMYVADPALADPSLILDGEIQGFQTGEAKLKVGGGPAADKPFRIDAGTPEAAVQVVLHALEAAKMPSVDAVGYRVVHPGSKLKGHQLITPDVLRNLDQAAEFAPLHDPVVLTIIRELMKKMPEVGHYACFDTVFHETMPEEAIVYAIPVKYRDRGVKRYGFHGLSCESIVAQMRDRNKAFPRRAVIAHLGSGCSVTALLNGKSIDTSMGLTPTGGVVMGTRPGDLDPGLMVYLMGQGGKLAALDQMLNHHAGMVALSEMENDVKALRASAADGNPNALLALKVFTRSVRKAIGSYAWLLGGLDAVIFSGGIGEHDAKTWSEVLTGLEELGIRLDEVTSGEGVRTISAADSKVEAWVVPAKEDWMIAVHVAEMAGAV